MRITYIVQHFSGPAGSSGSRPYENARRLVQMGHEVNLICGSFDLSNAEDISSAKRAGIQVHQAAVGYGQHQSYLRRLISFRKFMLQAIGIGMRLPRPDIILASSTPLTVGEIGRRLAAHQKSPFVFEVRDVWPDVPIALGALNNPILRWSACRMARRIYEAADHIVALSPGMKDQIIPWGVEPDRISVIPNCSDTTLFGSDANREAVRSRLGWTDKFVCIHPGSMGLVNGLDYLLDVAGILDREGPGDIHIAIMGNGSNKSLLAQRIALEGIRSASLYDPVPKRDMPDVLAAADTGLVVVTPIKALEANSSNKFFDFLASRLPVVINYGGWQSDVLRESGAGLSVDPEEPRSMAEALMRLRDDPNARASMARAARRLAEERYDRDLLVGQLEAILCRVASKSGCSVTQPSR